MIDKNDKEFMSELNRRIEIIKDPNYQDPSLKNLNKIDIFLIGFLIVFSILIFLWGWF